MGDDLGAEIFSAALKDGSFVDEGLAQQQRDLVAQRVGKIGEHLVLIVVEPVFPDIVVVLADTLLQLLGNIARGEESGDGVQTLGEIHLGHVDMSDQVGDIGDEISPGAHADDHHQQGIESLDIPFGCNIAVANGGHWW